jgi:hypothetical protein
MDASKIQDAFHYALFACKDYGFQTGYETTFTSERDYRHTVEGRMDRYKAAVTMARAEGIVVNVRTPRNNAELTEAAEYLASHIFNAALAQGVNAYRGEYLADRAAECKRDGHIFGGSADCHTCGQPIAVVEPEYAPGVTTTRPEYEQAPLQLADDVPSATDPSRCAQLGGCSYLNNACVDCGREMPKEEQDALCVGGQSRFCGCARCAKERLEAVAQAPWNALDYAAQAMEDDIAGLCSAPRPFVAIQPSIHAARCE